MDRDYSAFLGEIRSATDVVALVGEHLSLRRAGRRHKGLCPFHEEKTPSFTVDGDRGLFYCFGCQAGGDVFKFVMLRDGVDFAEAARALGARLGLKPPERRGPASDLRRRVLAANEAALSFFRARLADPGEGAAARRYLETRGVDAAGVRTFEIGFAPPSWDRLRDHLRAVGVPESDAKQAGLVAEREGGRGTYDRFRNRIIFPIRSGAGDVVAFGGRTLDPSEPAKYLNSPESPVYVKGEHLYGLSLARDAIREQGLAVLVEGYMDLVGVVAAGFPNAVATLGTALTLAQARLLRRQAGRVAIAYDGDNAGRQASLRAIEILIGLDFDVSVVPIDDGLDPDDFVRARGAEAFRRALTGSTPAVEFVAEQFARGADLSTPRGRAEGLGHVLPFLARVQSPVVRAGHLDTLARRFRVDDDLVRAELREALKRGARALPGAGSRRPAPEAVGDRPGVPLAELRLLGILVANADVRAAVLPEVDPSAFRGSRIEQLLLALREAEEMEPGRCEVADLADRLADDGARELLTRAVFDLGEEVGTEEEARACLRTVRVRHLEEERRSLQASIERGEDRAVLDGLLQRKLEIGRQIDALS